jgi:hypothetical protein
MLLVSDPPHRSRLVAASTDHEYPPTVLPSTVRVTPTITVGKLRVDRILKETTCNHGT